MIHKQVFVVLLSCLLMVGLVQAQSEATDKGAILISGTAAFTSRGGDLYEDFSGDGSTLISLEPSILYFISPGIGVGGQISLLKESRGDDSNTALEIGPKVSYFMDSGANTIPFISGGINYLTADQNISGYGIELGGGVILRRGQLAISLEASYVYESIEEPNDNESFTFNTILLGIGIGGFFY